MIDKAFEEWIEKNPCPPAIEVWRAAAKWADKEVARRYLSKLEDYQYAVRYDTEDLL